MTKSDFVKIFTDGACSGNPGPGGWGALLRYKNNKKEIYGNEDYTTNNRMELRAAIEGLNALTRIMRVQLYTDSTYVKNGITKWINNWKRNNWRTSANKPVKNIDLWQNLDKALVRHEVEWLWIKGHSGHPDNERVDKLAKDAIKNSILAK